MNNAEFIAHISRMTPVDFSNASDDTIEQTIVTLNWLINKAKGLANPHDVVAAYETRNGCSLGKLNRGVKA